MKGMVRKKKHGRSSQHEFQHLRRMEGAADYWCTRYALDPINAIIEARTNFAKALL